MAGEPESLDSDEPLPRRIARHNYDRLLMLSDGVFAIALTLLALEVRPPEHWSGRFHDLITAMWRPLFAYAFAFLIVAAAWFAHRNLFARMRRVDVPGTILTLLFLLVVAIAPAVAALIGAYGPGRAMPAYGWFMLVLNGLLILLWAYAAFPGQLVDPALDQRERIWRTGRLFIPMGAIILFLLLGFDTPIAGIGLALVAVAARVLSRRFNRAQSAELTP